jgi:hypothetical protein
MDTKNVIALWEKIILHRRNKTILSGLLSLLLFSSCETITEIDLPEEKPQLVINSIFNVDSLVKVNLTQSQSVNNKSLNFKSVENASIEIFKNATSIGFLHYKGKGDYLSESKLPYELNAAYSLKVRATGFETAETTEAIRRKPTLGSLKIKPDYQNSNTAYKSYNVGFDLNDAPEANYYFLRIWLVYSPTSKSAVYFRLNNDFGQFVPVGVAGSEMLVFDDHTFNRKAVSLNLDIFQANIGRDGDYTIQVELGSTSKSYYDYQFSFRKQVEGDPILNSADFPVANNIKNGLGIFAPYNAATLTFNIVR